MNEDPALDDFSYTMEIHHAIGYIHVIAKGRCTPQEVVSMYECIANTSKTTQINLLLLDVTLLKLEYHSSDVLSVLKRVRRMFKTLTLARIVDPADFKSDLIEAFAIKHKLNVKSFFNEQPALEWLVAQKATTNSN